MALADFVGATTRVAPTKVERPEGFYNGYIVATSGQNPSGLSSYIEPQNSFGRWIAQV